MPMSGATETLPDWSPSALPQRGQSLHGSYVDLVPVNPNAHLEALWQGSHNSDDPDLWQYLFYGPFPNRTEFRKYLEERATSVDELYYTIVEKTGQQPSGIASYLRMNPLHGVIEIGHIWFGVTIQRTSSATEAIYLLARHAFDDLGYRRLEWKCDALNQRSRNAALRFGFSFEGIFRQHLVVKGRNRDTAWYAMIDVDWPQIRAGFERWLSPDNFDSNGDQIRSLRQIRADARFRLTSVEEPPHETVSALEVRPARPEDEGVWREMWAGYNAFYQAEVSEEVTAATWRRILDPNSPISSLIALRDNLAVGFANYTVCPYTWSTRSQCLMEDLFVRPDARSSGVGRALIHALVDVAKQNGWTKVYWITQEDNARARRLYESIVPPDGFIQYRITVR